MCIGRGREIVCGVVAAAILATLPAQLAAAQFYETPRVLSVGGAAMALAVGNDAFYANPAAIALGNYYSVESGYFDDFRGNDRRVSASITDSHEKKITGGVGYVYRHKLTAENGADPDLTTSIHRFDVALAAQLAKGLAIGIQGRYVTTSDDLGDDDVEDSGFDQFAFDASAVLKTESGLALAVVGSNLINGDRPELPLRLGGAIGFGTEMFGIEVDLRHDFSTEKLWIAGGASLILGSMFAIRAGGSYDWATETAAISVGLGIQSTQFAADVGFRQKVSGPDRAPAPGLDTERIFALALRGIPFL